MPFSKVSRLTLLCLLLSLLACSILILLWAVFRPRGWKSVHTTWISQDSLVANGLTKTLLTSLQSVSWSLFLSHQMQFPESTASPFGLSYLSCRMPFICVRCCQRNLYAKSPALLHVTLGQLRFSSALPEHSRDPHSQPSTPLFLNITVKFFKHAEKKSIVNPHNHHSAPH